MNPLKNTTKNEVIGELRKHGYTVPGFARKIGAKPDTVKRVIYRYSAKEREAYGDLTKRILKALAPYARPLRDRVECDRIKAAC